MVSALRRYKLLCATGWQSIGPTVWKNRGQRSDSFVFRYVQINTIVLNIQLMAVSVTLSLVSGETMYQIRHCFDSDTFPSDVFESLHTNREVQSCILHCHYIICNFEIAESRTYAYTNKIFTFCCTNEEYISMYR
jgi:hypothetical protein